MTERMGHKSVMNFQSERQILDHETQSGGHGGARDTASLDMPRTKASKNKSSQPKLASQVRQKMVRKKPSLEKGEMRIS